MAKVYYKAVSSGDYLAHHGIMGQKWGVRRYQNPDGTLTAAGKKRYGAEDVESISSRKGIQRRVNDVSKSIGFNKAYERNNKRYATIYKDRHPSISEKFETNAKNYKNAMDKGEAEISRLLKKASDNGMTVSEKPVGMLTQSGRKVAFNLGVAGGLPGALLTTTVNAVRQDKDRGGNVDDWKFNSSDGFVTNRIKYKVSDKKK